MLQFDARHSNRAGMNGVMPCDVLLKGETIALIQGEAFTAPLCMWQDQTSASQDCTAETCMSVLLSSGTYVTVGALITTVPNLLHPLEINGVPLTSCEDPNESRTALTNKRRGLVKTWQP